MQKLDVIMKNRFRTDKPDLAAWETARHVEAHTGKSMDQESPISRMHNLQRPRPGHPVPLPERQSQIGSYECPRH